MVARLQAFMVAHGALVFFVGLVAGFPFAFLLLGRIELWPFPGAIDVQMPGDVRGWRMAHLEGLLNGIALFAVAGVLPVLQLAEGTLRMIAWTLVLTAWGNVAAAIVGPVFGGRGMAFGGGWSNSLMYLLFVGAVVTVMTAMVLVWQGARATMRASALPPPPPTT